MFFLTEKGWSIYTSENSITVYVMLVLLILYEFTSGQLLLNLLNDIALICFNYNVHLIILITTKTKNAFKKSTFYYMPNEWNFMENLENLFTRFSWQPCVKLDLHPKAKSNMCLNMQEWRWRRATACQVLWRCVTACNVLWRCVTASNVLWRCYC